MKTILMIGLFLCSTISALSQCDQSTVSKTTVGRFIQANSKQADIPFEATITITKEKIILKGNIAGQTLNITNTIQSIITCEWKEYLKTGQSVYKVVTDKGNGTSENGIIRITGKDGKTTILFSSDTDNSDGLELDIKETVTNLENKK